MNNVKLVTRSFDSFLFEKGLKLEAIVIGGGALNIMDIVSRATKDIDLIDPEIPEEIKTASIEFAHTHPEFKLIPENWINNGPISLIRDLPKGWRTNIQEIYNGKAIKFWTLSRPDLLRTKLYAYCDRDTDLDDCVALNPSEEEIQICLPWILKGDGNPMWPERVKEQLDNLREELKK